MLRHLFTEKFSKILESISTIEVGYLCILSIYIEVYSKIENISYNGGE